jgi:uncharacterized membrane protein
MEKIEFIKKLRLSLSGLPEEEIEDIILDYEEHFESGKESKRSEKELCQSLGDPVTIGRQLKANYHIEKAEGNASVQGILKAVLATAGLGFFNLIFVAFPFFGLLFFLFGLVFSGIAAFVSGVIGFVGSALVLVFPAFADRFSIFNGVTPAAALFICIAITGFSILFLIVCWYLLKWFYQLTVSYLKLNVKIIKG